MENNEDKRQMTVLHELYKAIDSIAFSSIDQGVHDVVGKEHVKSLIESLLPKERDLANKMFQAGINNVIPHSHTWDDETYQYEYYTIEEKEFEQVFNETFKPYEK